MCPWAVGRGGFTDRVFVTVLEGGGVPDDVIRVNVARARRVTVITVEGEVDTASAPLLHAALQDVKPGSSVILDLSGLTFIDSSGVRLLMLHAHRMRRAAGALFVRCPSPPVHHVMTLTGIDKLIEPHTPES